MLSDLTSQIESLSATVTAPSPCSSLSTTAIQSPSSVLAPVSPNVGVEKPTESPPSVPPIHQTTVHTGRNSQSSSPALPSLAFSLLSTTTATDPSLPIPSSTPTPNLASRGDSLEKENAWLRGQLQDFVTASHNAHMVVLLRQSQGRLSDLKKRVAAISGGAPARISPLEKSDDCNLDIQCKEDGKDGQEKEDLVSERCGKDLSLEVEDVQTGTGMCSDEILCTGKSKQDDVLYIYILSLKRERDRERERVKKGNANGREGNQLCIEGWMDGKVDECDG